MNFNNLQKQEFDKISYLILEVQKIFVEYFSVIPLNSTGIAEFISEINETGVGFKDYEIRQYKSIYDDIEIEMINEYLEDGLVKLSLYHKDYPVIVMFNFHLKTIQYEQNRKNRFLEIVKNSNVYWNN